MAEWYPASASSATVLTGWPDGRSGRQRLQTEMYQFVSELMTGILWYKSKRTLTNLHHRKETSMKSVLLVAISAISLSSALSACASGKNDSAATSGNPGNNGTVLSQAGSQTHDASDHASTLSRADEGIWNYIPDIIKGSSLMQAVILSDGSYWGIYGPLRTTGSTPKAPFNDPVGVIHGTASINGNRASGAYTDFSSKVIHGTYSGTALAKKNINLIFNNPSNRWISQNLTGATYNMSYDGIYNKPASLSEIAGTYHSAVRYLGGGPELVIAGSTLSIGCSIGGTIQPHGTVNVFDVNLTVQPTVGGYCSFFPSRGTNNGTNLTYKGILFKTSSGLLSDSIEIIATDGEEHGFFYRGIKQKTE